MKRLVLVPLLAALSFWPEVRSAANESPVSTPDSKLKEAFGTRYCVLRHAKLKLELAFGPEGAFVLACNNIRVIEDRKVILTHVLHAEYGRKKGKGDLMLSSIGESCSVELTFDRPVNTLEQMQKAQLKGIRFKDLLVTGVQGK